MPTYEYRCPACALEFERFQRMSDPPGAPCPDCGRTAERLISAGGGLLFKGEGFYITDYRSDAYKDRAKQDGGESRKEGEGGRKDAGGKSGRGSGASGAGAENDAGARGTRTKNGDAGRQDSRGAESKRAGSRRAGSPSPKDVGERREG